MAYDRGRVLVYGGTGTQGGPVADQLLQLGGRVRVLTRDADRAEHLAARGAEVAVADLGDPVSLARAHEGVQRVVLHLPLQYDMGLHEAYGRAAVEAAAEAGVSMLVMNTSAHVLSEPAVAIYRSRQAVVDLLAASGVPHVVLRPTFYMDNLLGPWTRPALVDQGVLAFPLPADYRMSWVSSEEVAAFAVAALDRPDLNSCVFDVGGPEGLTGDAMALALSDVLGRPVHYVPLTPDAYEQALVPLFGRTVAAEVVQQVRCLAARGDGTVDMSWPRRELGVAGLDFATWAARQRWT